MINELRIGNLIFTISEEPEVLKVEGIKKYDKNSDFNCVKLESIDNWIKIEDIQPIPLTEEWLLKMRFEDPTILQFAGIKCKPEPYYICDIRNLQVRPLTMQKGYMVEIVNSFTLPHIKYVHQLQNLYFALTGKELEINLKS